MLHENAVPPHLLTLLHRMQEATCSAGFALAGGTSLALRFGHRQSVDLDFFTDRSFDPQQWADTIGVGPESITGMAAGTLQLMLDGVKVEFLRHAYPKLAADNVVQGIRMWSLPDVSAMKLNAVSNRGSKKDFYDLATLLEHFPLQTLIDSYQAKYRPASLMMVIRSLAWFEDADAEPDPVSLRNETWPAVIEKISSAIRSLE